MVEQKSDLSVIHVPLLFKVFLRTSDGELTLKAAFTSDRMAGAWVIGMSHASGVECRIFEDREGDLFEVTPTAVSRAAVAMKADIDAQKE